MLKKNFKRVLIFIFLIFLCSISVFSDLFDGQVLYRTGPFFSIGMKYSDLRKVLVDVKAGLRVKYDTLLDYNVSDPLTAGLVKKESSFIIHSISSSNALGIYQMKPFFAEENGIANPFYPYMDKNIGDILSEYKSKLGNSDYSLAAYHAGFYGIQKDIKNSADPLGKKNIADYVNKIREYSRRYSKGDAEDLYDYLWIVAGMNSFDNHNVAEMSITVPELWLGHLNLNLKFDERLSASIYNELFINSFIQLYAGYDNGFVGGICLRANDWNSFTNVEFDLNSLELKWKFRHELDNFFYSLSFSKSMLGIEIGYSAGNFVFALGTDYDGEYSPFLYVGGKY